MEFRRAGIGGRVFGGCRCEGCICQVSCFCFFFPVTLIAWLKWCQLKIPCWWRNGPLFIWLGQLLLFALLQIGNIPVFFGRAHDFSEPRKYDTHSLIKRNKQKMGTWLVAGHSFSSSLAFPFGPCVCCKQVILLPSVFLSLRSYRPGTSQEIWTIPSLISLCHCATVPPWSQVQLVRSYSSSKLYPISQPKPRIYQL